ncbi:MAG TPA: site-specific integrase [Gaiellaceae bacterium]|nr:site-specific integrase [Gaiellaceae bacterium]
MPSTQQGAVDRLPRSWRARWYDEHGKRRTKAGFATKSEAREFLRGKVDEIDALRRGEAVPTSEKPQTTDVLLDLFLEKHGRTIDPATKRKLTAQLKHARGEFGDRQPGSLRRLELEDWREQLPAGSRHDVLRAFRQALTWAAARGYIDRDPSAGIKNPKRKRHERREVFPFETWEDVLGVSGELDMRYQGVPIVAVGCGLRPEELFGLHRADVDRVAGVLHVRRRFTGGMLKEGGKTAGSVRTVPLRKVVADALDQMPVRIDTPVLFPTSRGGYIDIERFRHREWAPAVRAAGIGHRRLYDCRHTFATWAIENGVQLSYLATIMGTSVRELEDTYFRWLRRTDDQLRAAFDSYDAKAFGSRAGHRSEASLGDSPARVRSADERT